MLDYSMLGISNVLISVYNDKVEELGIGSFFLTDKLRKDDNVCIIHIRLV